MKDFQKGFGGIDFRLLAPNKLDEAEKDLLVDYPKWHVPRLPFTVSAYGNGRARHIACFNGSMNFGTAHYFWYYSRDLVSTIRMARLLIPSNDKRTEDRFFRALCEFASSDLSHAVPEKLEILGFTRVVKDILYPSASSVLDTCNSPNIIKAGLKAGFQSRSSMTIYDISKSPILECKTPLSKDVTYHVAPPLSMIVEPIRNASEEIMTPRIAEISLSTLPQHLRLPEFTVLGISNNEVVAMIRWFPDYYSLWKRDRFVRGPNQSQLMDMVTSCRGAKAVPVWFRQGWRDIGIECGLLRIVRELTLSYGIDTLHYGPISGAPECLDDPIPAQEMIALTKNLHQQSTQGTLTPMW